MGPLLIYQVIKLLKVLKIFFLFPVNKICICWVRGLSPNPSLPVEQLLSEAV